jgi:hypothetical protein
MRAMCVLVGLMLAAIWVPTAEAGDRREVRRLSQSDCDGYAALRVVAPQRVYVERNEEPVYVERTRRPVELRQRRRPRRVVVERVRDRDVVRERVVDAGGGRNVQLGLFNFNR